jgi:hypothetical protein
MALPLVYRLLMRIYEKENLIMSRLDDVNAQLDAQDLALGALSTQLTTTKAELDAEIARIQVLLNANDGIAAADADKIIARLKTQSASVGVAAASALALQTEEDATYPNPVVVPAPVVVPPSPLGVPATPVPFGTGTTSTTSPVTGVTTTTRPDGSVVTS